MTEVRFHRDLYAEAAVRDAVDRYTSFAEVACIGETDAWCVTIHAAKPERERRIAQELGNFALGLTIRARKA